MGEMRAEGPDRRTLRVCFPPEPLKCRVRTGGGDAIAGTARGPNPAAARNSLLVMAVLAKRIDNREFKSLHVGSCAAFLFFVYSQSVRTGRQDLAVDREAQLTITDLIAL